MMWYWGGGMHWWDWLIGLVAIAAFWGLVAWAIWYFVFAVTRRTDHEHPTRGPKEILDERLARGEIDADEYRRLRDLMREDTHVRF